MKAMRNSVSVVCAILLCAVGSTTRSESTPPASNVAIGAVQFPQTVAAIPSICLYWCGRRIPDSFCVADDHGKRLTFKVQKDKAQRRFYMLVTESIRFVGSGARSAGTTVDHLEVPAGQPYKLYVLALQPEASTQKGQAEQYRWKVTQELTLNDTRCVPDETLIVRWNPRYVTGVEGGTANELPSLMLAQDMIESFGSEEKLQKYAVELLLTSLDCNMFHAPMSQEIKVAGNRVLALPITT